jgi:hypothetical protein
MALVGDANKGHFIYTMDKNKLAIEQNRRAHTTMPIHAFLKPPRRSPHHHLSSIIGLTIFGWLYHTHDKTWTQKVE